MSKEAEINKEAYEGLLVLVANQAVARRIVDYSPGLDRRRVLTLGSQLKGLDCNALIVDKSVDDYLRHRPSQEYARLEEELRCMRYRFPVMRLDMG